MSRYLLYFVFFLLPFAVYAVYLFLRDKNPLTGAAWTRTQLILLSLIGLFLSVFVVHFLAQHAGQQLIGRYEP